MANEGAHFATVLDRIGHDVLTTLEGLSDSVLNRPMAIPEANSLFAAATHLVGASEFWVLTLVGERTIDRDREAEFQSTGDGSSLKARYQRWLIAMHEVLDGIPNSELDKLGAFPQGHRVAFAEGPLTRRDCLLHAVEHGALHLGHLQITRQILAA